MPTNPRGGAEGRGEARGAVRRLDGAVDALLADGWLPGEIEAAVEWRARRGGVLRYAGVYELERVGGRDAVRVEAWRVS